MSCARSIVPSRRQYFSDNKPSTKRVQGTPLQKKLEVCLADAPPNGPSCPARHLRINNAPQVLLGDAIKTEFPPFDVRTLAMYRIWLWSDTHTDPGSRSASRIRRTRSARPLCTSRSILSSFTSVMHLMDEAFISPSGRFYAKNVQIANVLRSFKLLSMPNPPRTAVLMFQK